jgi:hypothetical protein
MEFRHMRDQLLVALGVGALVAAGAPAAFAGAAGEGELQDAPAAAPAAPCPEPDEAAVNNGNVSLTFQNDFTTAYFFRGILQENDGMIWQPTLAVGWKLYGAEEGALRAVSLGLGVWNSVHEEQTLASGSGPDVWYEADIYPSLSITWGGGVTTSLSYIWYTSPNNGFLTTEEVDLVVAFDDSPYLGGFALKPSLTLAFETKGGAFQDFWNGTSDGHSTGSLAILAIAPSYAVPISDDYPLTLTLPVTVALSMDDYYQDSNHNETFGYATLGLTANIPLAFIPTSYGTWSVTNGINLLFLNDALADVNADALPANDDFEAVWTSSVIMTY